MACFAADVAEGDALVFVDEEDDALGGFDQFLDLVLAEVAVEPALLVQAVGFVDDQHVEGVGLGLDETAGAGEHVGEAAAGDGAHQPGFVDLAWRGVLGHVLADQAEPGEVDQQVDRHHRLAGARAALDDQVHGDASRRLTWPRRWRTRRFPSGRRSVRTPVGRRAGP